MPGCVRSESRRPFTFLVALVLGQAHRISDSKEISCLSHFLCPKSSFPRSLLFLCPSRDDTFMTSELGFLSCFLKTDPLLEIGLHPPQGSADVAQVKPDPFPEVVSAACSRGLSASNC